MKVIAQTGALLEALNLANSIVAARTPKPVLKCVKLVAADNVLTIVATDLEAGCRYQVTAVQIEQEGEALAPADRLAAVVRESADEQSLSVETDKDACLVRAAAGRFRILGYDPAEYPAVAEFAEPADFTVQAAALGEMIGRTLFATAKTHSHYAYAGVLWEATGKKLTLVATDGHRLAQAKGSLKKSASRDITAIVPTKFMSLVQRAAGEGGADEVLEVKITENQIQARTPRATLVSSLVQGNFPRYADVIPKECAMKAAINTQQFEHRVRQAALLADEESRSIKLNFQGQQVTLTSRAPETGEAEVTCPVKYEGDQIELGFTPAFLIDALRVVDVDEISFEMNANNKPAVLKAGSDFLYALMPLDPG